MPFLILPNVLECDYYLMRLYPYKYTGYQLIYEIVPETRNLPEN